jgi:hypothetical protein
MPLKMRQFGSFVSKVCDSPPAKAIGLLAAVVGVIEIGSVLHKPIIKPSSSVPTSGSATDQSSNRFQSPNLSDGQRNVQILYGSTIVNGTPPPVPSGHRIISQTSTGDQSPNINGVGGNVDIHYGSSTAR